LGFESQLIERCHELSTRIKLDRYVYEDIYPAFKASTDEKAITADLNHAFLNYLAQGNLVLAGPDPVAVADIGCGPCDTLIKYLKDVRFAPGFIVRATDYLTEYADIERGEALQTLAAAQVQGTIKLASYSVQAGDAFSGNLLGLLSRPEDRAKMQNAFSIVYASHVLYHADSPPKVPRLIADVASNLLSGEGVSILFHIANTPGTFQDFRARFGSEAGGTANSDTGAVTIDDPPAQIQAACAANSLPLWTSEFVASLRFGSLADDEWRAFKDLGTYDALAEANPAAYEDLKRLYFIVQRAPAEFAADRSATGLHTFVDEIRRVIEANHGVLPSAERMQVFIRTDSAPLLRELIPEAIAASMGSSATQTS
jgi:hypothetical protein